MSSSGRSDLIDIAATLHHETHPDDPDAGAFLIDAGFGKVWVPKAAVEYDRAAGTFAMPERLAKEKGLI